MMALLLPVLQASGNLGLSCQPGPRMAVGSGGHAAVVVDGALFVVGGTNWRGGEKFWLGSIYRFDVGEGEWSSAGRLPMSIAYAASASAGDRLYLCGGSDGERPLRSCVRLSSAGRGLKCEPLAPLPEARVYAGAAVCGGVLYVVGGAADQADLATTTGALFGMPLDGARRRWQALAPLTDGRFIPAVTAAGGKLYVFGGGRLNAKGEPQNLADSWVYEPEDDAWTRLPDLPQAARGIDAATVSDDLILLFGGYTATAVQARRKGPAFGFSDQVLAFRPSEQAFERVGRMPYAAIGTAPVLAGGRIYLTGGEDRMRHRSDRLSVVSWR